MLYMTELILHGCADIVVTKNTMENIILGTSINLHEVDDVRRDPVIWTSLHLL